MKPENNQEVDIVVYPQYDYHHPVQQYNNLMSERQNLNSLQRAGKITWDKYLAESTRLYNLQKMVGRKLAQDLIIKYKGTKFDPTYNWSPGGGIRVVDATPEYIREQVVDGHTREDDTGVKDWFKSYVTSPGYEQIVRNQIEFLGNANGANNLRTVVLKDMDKKKLFYTNDLASWSFGQPYLDRAYIKVGWDNKGSFEFPKADLEGHELAHLFTTPYYNKTIVPQQKILDANTGTTGDHDSRPDEKHADVWGAKYLLYKEGIHDVRKGPVTVEHIKELRKRYPKYRILQQMDDEKVTWMLNHVAQNTNNPYSDPNKVRV